MWLKNNNYNYKNDKKFKMFSVANTTRMMDFLPATTSISRMPPVTEQYVGKVPLEKSSTD